MSILVLKQDGEWREWHGQATVQRMVAVYTAVYGDGRQVETPCDPYPVETTLEGDRVRSFYDQGIWSLEEIEAVGGRFAKPFDVPDGKQVVGSPTYSELPDGSIEQVYDVEDTPPPPEPPTQEEKVQAMLAAFDLTIAELKGVLGIG